MSFFETASLVLISDFAAASASAVSGSGANTGKAYSVKPTDGSGDFDFERGSDITATRVNSSGYIEKGRGNFLLQSNQFDTTWVKSNVNLTGSQSGYDGSNDAWILRKTGTTGNINQTVSSLTNVQTFSIYAKPGDLNWIRIIRAGKFIDIDLENQVTGSKSGGIIDIEITPINEWSRISLTVNQTATNTVIYPADGDNDISGTSGFIYIQDAQLEQGLVATDYIETTTAPLRAGLLEDEPRFDYHNSASASPSPSASLLLEPSRTNSWIHSEYLDYSFSNVTNVTITQNTTETLSPEGKYNAIKLEGVGAWTLRDAITATVTGDWTVSCYVKAVNPGSNNTFRLSAGGNNFSSDLTATSEWQRFEFTVSNGGASNNGLIRKGSSNDADLYIYGMQVEQGSYATSYIPTYGAAATRGEDVFQNSTNDTPLGAIGQGTWFIELQKLGDDLNQALYLAPTSNNTQQIRLHFDATNARFRDARNGYSTIGVAVNVKTSMTKMAISIDTTSGIAKAYANGSQLGSDYTLQANPFEFSRIVAESKGYILKQSLFFPEALSDTDCEILTGATTYSSFAAMASALNYTVYE